MLAHGPTGGTFEANREQRPRGACVDNGPGCAAVDRMKDVTVVRSDPELRGGAKVAFNRVRPGSRRERKSRCVDWPAAGSDDIARSDFHPMPGDVHAFTPVGVREQSALLQEHGAVVIRSLESVSRKIAVHVALSVLPY